VVFHSIEGDIRGGRRSAEGHGPALLSPKASGLLSVQSGDLRRGRTPMGETRRKLASAKAHGDRAWGRFP